MALAKQSNAIKPSSASSALKTFIAQKQNSSLQSTPGKDESKPVQSIEASITQQTVHPSSKPSSPIKSNNSLPFTTSPLRSHSAEHLSPQKQPQPHPLLTKSPSQLFRVSSSVESVSKPTRGEVTNENAIGEAPSAMHPIDQQPVQQPLSLSPHRKSPIRHAKSADSFLTLGTSDFSSSSIHNSPSANKTKRQVLEPEVLQLTGSPMKIDSAGVGNESVYLDAIETSSDDEIILNVKNLVKYFERKSPQTSPKYRESHQNLDSKYDVESVIIVN